MRLFTIVIMTILFASCKKETLENNIDFERFIGEWKSIGAINNEQISINFKKNGVIIVKKSLERTERFIPQSSTKKTSDVFSTNGTFWDYYYFNDENNTGSENINIFNISPTSDTIIIFNPNIENFVYTLGSYTKFTKK